MSIPQAAGGPIQSRDDLVRYIADGAKPRDQWRIGTEHEKFVYDLKTYRPLSYAGHPGIREMLEGMQRFGWKPVMEGDHIIGLSQDSASISLEPGGQFELAGAPLKSLHQTCSEVNTHQSQIREIAGEIGAGVLGIGYAPTWRLDEVDQMPKGRYAIMKSYMPKVGGYGLEMMFRTCTVQVNLDFASEPDMVKKLRVALALQPVATALFANSPFREGRPNGFLSYRSQIWTDVDNARAGMLPFAFEDGFGFERYVDYALDVPMYFVYRDGRYIDVAGKCFRDFLDGRIPELKGVVPQLSDWADHLTTIFPEARLKRIVEMRGADGGTWRRICGLPALWVGVLYDQGALDAAWDMVKDWTCEERAAMRASVPALAFNTPFRGRKVLDLAREMLEIAQAGLRARAREDAIGTTEEGFLQPLVDLVERGYTRAEELLRKWREEWNGDLSRLFTEYNFL
jgi:glutamate--cysteine ligase